MRRLTIALVAAATLIAVAAIVGFAAGCGASSVPSDAVATVGDASVTKTEYQQLLTQAQAQMKASGMTMPAKGSATYDHYVAQVVDYLIQEEVVAQSAEQLGVSVTDKEVNDQIAQIEKAYGGEKKVLSLLKQQGMTMEQFTRSIRNQSLAQRAAAVVTKKASVSDAQIQAYWKAHKAQYLKKKKTNTLAKAKATIKQTLLSANQQQLWSAWLSAREKALGVAYAAGYDPAQLTASPSASASSSGG